MTSPFSWAVAQIGHLPNAAALQCPKFNPKPPGVILEGSATGAVLRVLNAHPGRFFTCGELMTLTGRSHSATSWALIRLHKVLGIVETAPDPRQDNYRRYRLKQGAAR